MITMTLASAILRARTALVAGLVVVALTAVLFPGLCLSAPSPLQNSTIREEMISLPEGGTVRIENFRGSTHVNAWSDNTVRVVAERKGSRKEPLSPGDLLLMSAGNNLVIQCKQTGQADRVDMTVYVPSHSGLIVAGGAWPVEVAGSLAGAIVETTSGDIGYKLSADDQIRLSMRSTTGVVRTTLPLQASQRAGYHSLQGVIGAGAIPIVLNSHSGNITLVPTPGSSRSIARRTSPGTLPARGQQAGNLSPYPAAATTGRNQNSQTTSSGADFPGGASGGSSNGSSGGSGSSQGTADPTWSGSGPTADIGGNRSSQSGDSKTKIGPFSGEREVKRTSENSAGLGVHIIPSNQALGGGYSNQTSGGSQSSGRVIYDPGPDPRRNTQVDPDDPDSNAGSGSANGSGSRRPSSGSSGSSAAPSLGSSGPVDFGGNRSSQNGDVKTRVGPFSGEREVRSTEENSQGVGVHIIPSGQRPNSTYTPTYGQTASQNNPGSGSTYQDRGNGNRNNQSVPYTLDPRYDPARPASVDGSTSQGARAERTFDRQAAANLDAQNGDPALDPGNGPRRETPPVLGRNNAGGSSSAEAIPVTSAGDSDDAIVLKSALVNLNVSVLDRAGKSLTDLKKESFRVLENGRPQPVQFFAPSTSPFNLVLVLDLSGSIYDKIAVVKSAALHFLDILQPQDRVAVITFTRSVGVLSYLTGDRDLLRERIKNIQRPEGGTAFYEAMWFTVAEVLKGTQGQRNAIVVMTDGVDNSLERNNPARSRVSFQQLAHRLEESDAIVFPVYLDTEYEEVFERGNSSSEAYAIAQDQLQRLAEVTGGWMFRATEARDLKGVYNQVAAALRTVYSVGYAPTNPERDGSYRRVRVEIIDQPDVAVRTRKGYFAQ